MILTSTDQQVETEEVSIVPYAAGTHHQVETAKFARMLILLTPVANRFSSTLTWRVLIADSMLALSKCRPLHLPHCYVALMAWQPISMHGYGRMRNSNPLTCFISDRRFFGRCCRFLFPPRRFYTPCGSTLRRISISI